jgi:hypothetical protein
MGAYPTIRFGSDAPLPAPANSVNILFTGAPSTGKPTQVNLRADLVGPGGTTQFLRADGTWAPAGGGASAFGNLAVLPALGSGGVVAGYTAWVQIPASALLFATGTKIKVRINVTATDVVIAAAVIRRAAAFGTSFIDSTPITWGSSATPTFSSTGLQTSDEIAVTVDIDHDYWVLVYFDPSTTGTVAVNTGTATSAVDFTAGYQFGDQTATAMASLSPAAGYLKGIQQILAE